MIFRQKLEFDIEGSCRTYKTKHDKPAFWKGRAKVLLQKLIAPENQWLEDTF